MKKLVFLGLVSALMSAASFAGCPKGKTEHKCPAGSEKEMFCSKSKKPSDKKATVLCNPSKVKKKKAAAQPKAAK